MKLKPFATLGCALFLVSAAFIPTRAGAEAKNADSSGAPSVSIDRVLAIANQSLVQRGQEAVYIESITLTRPAVFAGKQKQNWFVKWSRPLPASKPEIREIGLSVAMDGKVTHVVK